MFFAVKKKNKDIEEAEQSINLEFEYDENQNLIKVDYSITAIFILCLMNLNGQRVQKHRQYSPII